MRERGRQARRGGNGTRGRTGIEPESDGRPSVPAEVGARETDVVSREEARDGTWLVAAARAAGAARAPRDPARVRHSRSAEPWGDRLSIADMENTTSRKQARAKMVERQRDAAAAREARERANIGDLTEFTVQSARVDEVDGWLAQRLEALHAEAERRRDSHRMSAGRALQRMRMRGETIPCIAEAAGVSIKRVRGYLKTATQTMPAGEFTTAAPPPRVSPLPTLEQSVSDGRSVRARDAAAQEGT